MNVETIESRVVGYIRARGREDKINVEWYARCVIHGPHVHVPNPFLAGGRPSTSKGALTRKIVEQQLGPLERKRHSLTDAWIERRWRRLGRR